MQLFVKVCATLLLLGLSIVWLGTAQANNDARPAYARTTDPIVYHGKVVKPNGKPIDGDIAIRLQILSPEPSLCILWAETIVSNAKNGGFSVEIGHDANRRPGRFGGAARSFREVFLNNPGLVIENAECQLGDQYVPGFFDDRLLRAEFQVDGQVVSTESIPIKAIPFAKQANEISGYGINNLLRISGAGAPTTVFDPSEVEALKSFSGSFFAREVPAAAGAADQIIGMNSSGDGVEFKSITAGPNIVLSHVPGGIQIGAELSGISSTEITAALGYTPISNASASEVIGVLGYTPLNQALGSGQVYVGDGANVGVGRYLQIGDIRSTSGSGSDPFLAASGSCSAGEVLGYNSVSDKIECTPFALTASQISGALADNSIAFAKLQDIASGSLLGRSTAGSGDIEELTLGSGLSLTGGVLSSSGLGGTVTSVGVSVPAFMTSAGGPITSSGSITLGFGSQSAAQVFASPAGASGAPIFRSLAAVDIPSLDATKITSGTLPVAQGGTGSGATLLNNRVMVSSGGNIVEATVSSTELGYLTGVTSAIQTQLDSKQASGNYISALTGDVTATGPGSASSTIASNAVTTTKIANSNVTYAKIQDVSTNNRILGRSTAGAGVIEEVTVGSGLALSGGVLSSSGLGGTVTSVGVAVPAYMTSTGGPITSSGSVTLGFGSQSAAQVFASPSGAAGAPIFRSLAAVDIPSLDAAKITSGTLAGTLLPAYTGDVTKAAGSTTTTVATVGGVTAANVAAGANLANAATSANTVSAIVRRDASGNFSAGAITASSVSATTITSTGSLTNGGFDFILGNSDQVTRGNSGASRALVKDGGNLLHINFAGDFTGGTQITGNLNTTGTSRATAFVSTSDRRLKTDIKRIDGLAIINALNGYSYRWKKNGEADMGVIAQEVQAIAPELVVTDKAGFRAVKYNGLIAALIDATHQIQRSCDRSKEEIAELKKENEMLKRLVDDLVSRVERLERK